MPPRKRASSWLTVLCLAGWVGFVTGPAAGEAASGDPEAGRYAGAYAIDGWEALERQGIRHVFQLRADETFVLGADWPEHERSRFTGTWSLSGERIVLHGEGEVWTNQGSWRTPFLRGYAIDETGGAIRLTPIPEKNRYGLLGWPNPFVRAIPKGG
jgi:hypothetical protein